MIKQEVFVRSNRAEATWSLPSTMAQVAVKFDVGGKCFKVSRALINEKCSDTLLARFGHVERRSEPRRVHHRSRWRHIWPHHWLSLLRKVSVNTICDTPAGLYFVWRSSILLVLSWPRLAFPWHWDPNHSASFRVWARVGNRGIGWNFWWVACHVNEQPLCVACCRGQSEGRRCPEVLKHETDRCEAFVFAAKCYNQFCQFWFENPDGSDTAVPVVIGKDQKLYNALFGGGYSLAEKDLVHECPEKNFGLTVLKGKPNRWQTQFGVSLTK